MIKALKVPALFAPSKLPAQVPQVHVLLQDSLLQQMNYTASISTRPLQNKTREPLKLSADQTLYGTICRSLQTNLFLTSPRTQTSLYAGYRLCAVMG